MFKIVTSAVLAATAMAGFSGAALALDVPANFVGQWKEAPEDQPKDSSYWTITPDGNVYECKEDDLSTETKVAGEVEKIDGSEIRFKFTSGEYKGTIHFDRLTNKGEVTFTAAPGNSPKKKNPGPYKITMTRE